MADIAKNINISGRLDGRTAECLIASSSTIYEGTPVFINNTGFATAVTTDANTFKFFGFAIKGGTGDGTSVTCVVERRGTRWYPKASVTQADMGKLAYITPADNSVATTTAPTTGGALFIAGRIMGIDTTNNLVEIDLEDRVA